MNMDVYVASGLSSPELSLWRYDSPRAAVFQLQVALYPEDRRATFRALSWPIARLLNEGEIVLFKPLLNWSIVSEPDGTHSTAATEDLVSFNRVLLKMKTNITARTSFLKTTK